MAHSGYKDRSKSYEKEFHDVYHHKDGKTEVHTKIIHTHNEGPHSRDPSEHSDQDMKHQVRESLRNQIEFDD